MKVTNVKEQLFRRAVIGLAATLVAAVLLPSRADAYVLNGCKWNHRTIRFYVPAPLLSNLYWSKATETWSGLHAGYVLTGTNPDIRGTNVNYGNSVAWTGVVRTRGTVQTPPSCPGGYFGSDKVEVVMNWNRIDDYSPARKKMVAAHELGHTFGLAHSANLNLLMYKNDNRTVLVPQSNDRSGVNAIYP